MLLDIFKGIGMGVVVASLVALWVVPNPIGKILEFWRFWRGE
jgi:hypothetical protein